MTELKKPKPFVSETCRKTRQKISKILEDLSNTINRLDFIDIYTIQYSIILEKSMVHSPRKTTSWAIK